MKNRDICWRCIRRNFVFLADPVRAADEILKSAERTYYWAYDWMPLRGVVNALNGGTQLPFCRVCKFAVEHAAAHAVRTGSRASGEMR
jgi:hypothetical protein